MTPVSQHQIGRGGYALSFIGPLRYLRTQMDSAQGGAVSLTAIAKAYRHDLSSDLYRVTQNEDVSTKEEANAWLIHEAARVLGKWLDVVDKRNGETFISMKPGMCPDDLRWHGKKIHPEVPKDPQHYLVDLWDALKASGIFVDNIRARGKDDLEELRESMRAVGWLDHHPAILDEFGRVIVGHRRLAVAKELGIEPKTVKLNFGRDIEAAKRRIIYGVFSNLGNKSLNAADRAKIATALYQDKGWTMAKIAEVLKVNLGTISRDLDKDQDHSVVADAKTECHSKEGEKSTSESSEHGGKGDGAGRPKGSRSGAISDKLQRAIDAYVRRLATGERTRIKDIAEEAGVGDATAHKAVAIYNARQQAELVKEESTSKGTPMSKQDDEPETGEAPWTKDDLNDKVSEINDAIDDVNAALSNIELEVASLNTKIKAWNEKNPDDQLDRYSFSPVDIDRLDELGG